jgi:hypothetical protein
MAVLKFCAEISIRTERLTLNIGATMPAQHPLVG